MKHPAASLASLAAPAAAVEPRAVLEAGLGAYFGRPLRIVALAATPSAMESTHPVTRLAVTLDSGERLAVLFKQLQPRPDHAGNQREVLIYRHLLTGRRFGAPALYASLYDPPVGRYWLFLEDLGDWALDAGDWDEWLAASRRLADLHAAYWGRAAELRALGCLGEHDSLYYQAIAARARANLAAVGSAAALVRFDHLQAEYDALVAFLAGQPRILVHGDIFPENVLITEASAGQRDMVGSVHLIDWESAACGLGAWDLTRLVDGWARDAPALLVAYQQALTRQLPGALDWAMFRRTLAHCRVLNVLWHLGWEVEYCLEPGFVDAALDALAVAWTALDRGAG